VSFTLDTVVDDVTIDAPFDVLDAVITGSVHTPEDAEYAAHVTPWNLAVPLHPSAVVDARSAEDVAAAVRFAGAFGLTAGVQATGHGAIPGIAGQLLISTKGLDEVTVHPEGWARVGAGVKWLRVVQEAAPYGLAPLSGSVTDVGVVGYTTGGGVGPMARSFGLAADKVRAFDVVTGDGVVRRATPTEHPDLFFALRGGKGTAGIVTAVEFDLVHLPTFYGGSVWFDGADAPRVIEAWRSWADELPEAGTTSFGLFQLPPMPSACASCGPATRRRARGSSTGCAPSRRRSSTTPRSSPTPRSTRCTPTRWTRRRRSTRRSCSRSSPPRPPSGCSRRPGTARARR
jgi:FAD/FMN-containing dehydrogenase